MCKVWLGPSSHGCDSLFPASFLFCSSSFALDPDSYFLASVLVAGQCLHTVSEDNPALCAAFVQQPECARYGRSRARVTRILIKERSCVFLQLFLVCNSIVRSDTVELSACLRAPRPSAVMLSLRTDRVGSAYACSYMIRSRPILIHRATKRSPDGRQPERRQRRARSPPPGGVRVHPLQPPRAPPLHCARAHFVSFRRRGDAAVFGAHRGGDTVLAGAGVHARSRGRDLRKDGRAGHRRGKCACVCGIENPASVGDGVGEENVFVCVCVCLCIGAVSYTHLTLPTIA